MEMVNIPMLCEEELKELKSTTVFDCREIEYLYERFVFLDKMNVGFLTYNELNNIPEFEINPFNKLILNVLEKRLDYERISFPHFLDFLGIFNKKTDKSERMKFLFDVFDINSDGKLCKSVLFNLYSIMGGTSMDEVNYLLELYDRGKKGYLNFSDFKVFYDEDPSIEKNMVIDFTKNIKEPHKVGLLDIILPSFSCSKKSE